MDNPYWSSYGQVHHIDLDSIRLLCFELSNIFYASKTISNNLAASEQLEENKVKLEEFPLAKLHYEYSFKKSSELLLQLALLVRTYDDQMKDSEFKDKYIAYVRNNDCGNYIGTLSGKNQFYVRHACNKIIHAYQIRPLYEKSDVGIYQVNDQEFGDNIWYLTGEVELSGIERQEEWEAVLYLTHFLETILELIEFNASTSS